MAVSEDDDRAKKPAPHVIGQDVSTLSLAELGERIGLLNAEIRRLEAAIKEKSASRDAAQSFFKA